MKKYPKITIWAGIVLCVLNILWLGYNSYQYLYISEWFESPEVYVMLIFIGLLVLFISHILISFAIIVNLKRQTNTFISGMVLLIIGSVSFIAMFFHWGALSDILKEYPAGLEIQNELKAVWISHILHFSFITYALVYLTRVRKIQTAYKPSSGLIGEQLFVSLHIIGIVCGITGLLIVLVDFFFRVNPQSYKWAIIPYSIFIFIPYLLVLTGWFIQAISDKKSGWYDEKQKSDIYKSSAFTLLTSIPIMFSLFLFNYHRTNGMLSILWLPFYLFMVLFVFSISALYNYKSG